MKIQTQRSTFFKNQNGNITQNGGYLKLVNKFTYHRSSVSFTQNDINVRIVKAWTDIDRLSILWISNLPDKIKRNRFQAAVLSILQYGYTTWTLTKRIEKNLLGNWTRMLRAILDTVT